MPQLKFIKDGQQSEVSLAPGESVLDALIRSGHSVPYGCRSGVCQSCKLRSDDPVPKQAQKGLTPAQAQLGYFLSCQCYPDEALSVKSDASVSMYSAKIVDKDWLSDSVLRLRLEKVIDYAAGQFVTLFNPDRQGRCYSLASHPEIEDYLEFHIKHLPSGTVSHWLAESTTIGDSILISTPQGECFYTQGEPDKPLILSGIGTGFAPLYGIIKDAIHQGHTGPMHLLMGGKNTTSLYYQDLMAELPDSISKTIAVQDLESAPATGVLQADIYSLLNGLGDDLGQARAFLCGAESFVQKMRKMSFLAGVPMGNISADAFSSPQTPTVNAA